MEGLGRGATHFLSIFDFFLQEQTYPTTIVQSTFFQLFLIFKKEQLFNIIRTDP